MRGRWPKGEEWWRPMPPGTSADALKVLAARGVRAFGDGYVALLLPIYLVELGFSALAVGIIVTSTLIGTALLTLWVGWIANRHSRRLLLLASAVLMAATGAGFALIASRRPCRHDEPDFRRCEHFCPARAHCADADDRVTAANGPVRALQCRRLLRDRTRRARGGFSGFCVGVDRLHPDRRYAIDVRPLCGAGAGRVPSVPASVASGRDCDTVPTAPLGPSKKLVYGMAALFGMDSFGTGFLVQSLLALWLYQAFQVSVTTTATILFWTGVCSAVSYLVAVPIAERI